MTLEEQEVAHEPEFKDINVDILLFNDDQSGSLFILSGKCRMFSADNIWRRIHIIR